MCFNGNSRVINWDHMTHRHSGIPRMKVKSFLMTACSLCVHAINSMFMDFCWVCFLGVKRDIQKECEKGWLSLAMGIHYWLKGQIQSCVCIPQLHQFRRTSYRYKFFLGLFCPFCTVMFIQILGLLPTVTWLQKACSQIE